MTRRGERVTRTMLRVGLLLGGMVAVWAGHELAATDTAYAADRAPVAPVEATVDLLTDVLTPVRDTLAPGSPGPVERAAPAAVAPPGRVPCASPPARPGGTPHRRVPPPARPTPAEARTPSTRPVVAPPRARLTPPGPADTAPVRAGQVLTPVTETLRPITGPVNSRVLTPVAGTLRPITDPVRDDVLTPIAAVLRPVTEVLDPVLAPVGSALDPVLGALDPVLDPLAPVTEQAVSPPASTPVAPAPPDGSASATAPLPSADSVVAASAPAAEPQSRTSALIELVRADRSRPLGPSGTRSRPPVPTPDHSGAGASGGGHGELADATVGGWAPSTRSAHHRAPSADAVRPTRSPRPGTRPA